MNSAIYHGWVRHRRFEPRAHTFHYRVFMPYLQLDELPEAFSGSVLWSDTRPAPARFRRDDFLGDPALPLEEAVRQRVQQATGRRPAGPIRLLANLRYFGFIMNPIACYYCFDEAGETVEYIVAEVTNTPWRERHSYVLPADLARPWLRTTFAKTFHVSPFHPMDMQYRWHSNTPGEKLVLHLANEREGRTAFDATLSLDREPLTAAALNRHLLRYPLMTAKVGAAIYWQALRLWLKKTPFFPHPETTHTETAI